MAGSVTYNGLAYDAKPTETVLDVLLRNALDVSYSCKSGSCQTCIMQAQSGTISPQATSGLTESQRAAGLFLPCQCELTDEVVIGPPVLAWHETTVRAVEPLTDHVTRVCIADPGLEYAPGQYVQLRRPDGLERTYSIANSPDSDHVELHVGQVINGAFSGWVRDELKAGDTLYVSDPSGSCCYDMTNQESPILLIGTGTGLAPLIGIARTALANKHTGPIHLLHGAGNADRLYLQHDLLELTKSHDNFHYLPCIKSGQAEYPHHQGDLESGLTDNFPTTANFAVFLCGNPIMIDQMRTATFLRGADFQNIRCDAFTIRGLA